ncbi:MAG: hypothetical protein ACRD1L_01650 [Terriglobales bacterium]
MIASVLALAWLGLAQATPPPRPAHHKAHAAPEAKPPAGPKTAEELQQDLEAALRAAPLADDQLSLAIEGKDITLSGEVHSAEHKGVATRVARKVAEKDGWSGFHVLSHVEVGH